MTSTANSSVNSSVSSSSNTSSITLTLNTARMGAVKPSATLAMAAKAKALAQKGVDVANLSVGEPDFNTPRCILDAAHAALEGDVGHYTVARGTDALVASLRQKLQREQGVSYAVNEVIATVGTKGALSMTIDALIGAGDEVIIFAPYWVTYPDLVRLAGGTPVTVRTTAEQGFRPTPQALKDAITPRTKAVIINVPSNPTGASMDREHLQALMAVLEGTNIWVISDEIYDLLTYDGFKHASPASVSNDARARTVIVGGAAKGYAMTGWRLGFAAGPSTLIDAVLILQQQRATCPSAIAQAAAAYAFAEPPEVLQAVEEMRVAYARRRRLVLDFLADIPGATVHPPEGAFYCFVELPSRLPATHKGRSVPDDVALAGFLLEEARVATVPGTPFGAAGGLRLSFAAADEVLVAGITRMKEWLADLV